MSDISVGAVGAATVAGLVSLLGLVIGKEQKVSEFRQAWIDDLRRCIVSYLVCINAISDAITIKKSGDKIESDTFLSNYKELNEASHGIILRINLEEQSARDLRDAMLKFESVASSNSTLTPEKIKSIETGFIDASKNLLKFEWNRVKRGEEVFVWSKWIVISAIGVMGILFIYLWAMGDKPQRTVEDKDSGTQVVQTLSTQLSCNQMPQSGLASAVTQSATPAAAVTRDQGCVSSVSSTVSLSPSSRK